MLYTMCQLSLQPAVRPACLQGDASCRLTALHTVTDLLDLAVEGI